MDLWSKVLNRINDSISKPSFQTWFVDTIAEKCDDVVIVKAKNEFAVDWLRERYLSLISETVREVAGKTYKIDFASEDKEEIVKVFMKKISRGILNALVTIFQKKLRKYIKF
ncbi:DnaA N-terminal domain-containing protein [Bacillus marasmi]|uniref:DnaA N-terminal domain-containing protein n=1 Tax=Bacillus marasmi TaxID=1926279 RepID=UPI0011CB5391|nr:DnaA N-terminal domain-containing protein [Bacillus marasmi]